MIPGRGASTDGIGVAALAAQVVHQVLAVDDEPHLVRQPRVLERVAGELAILLVVVREQDRDRPAVRCSGGDMGLLAALVGAVVESPARGDDHLLGLVQRAA